MELELNTIYNLDNVQGMKMMDAESVDLVVTSPPYDNLRNYNGYSFDFENVSKELFRILKVGGVIVWIVNDAMIDGSETGTSFRQALGFMDVGFNLHDTMIWCKDGGGAVGSNYAYSQNFEYMFVLSKGRPKTFNPIKDKKNLSYKENGNNKITVFTKSRRNVEVTREDKRQIEIQEFSKRNNWWIFTPSQEEGSYFHPAIFPEKLVRDHIISWSNEGDLVLDPFMGSGTTAKVARSFHRNFIGFEISTEYWKLANKRLQDTKTLWDL